MPNTFFGLNIATSGLYAASVNLNVTANNGANAKTDGYSRQQATQVAKNALRVYQEYGMIGAGVKVTGIERVRDAFYDKKYIANQTKLGECYTKYYHSKQMEDHLNEATVDGFTKEYSNFFDSIQEVQKNPSSIPARTAMISYGESLMDFFEQVKTNFRLQQEDINAEISDNVDKINSTARDIAALNEQINAIELTGASANELRDKRDLLLDSLSEICEIQTNEKVYENGKTEFTVKLGTNTLVDNYSAFQLKVVSRDDKVDEDDAVGLYDIQWSYGEEFNPVKAGLGGTLTGLIQSRDGNNGVRNGKSQDSYEIDYKGIVYYIDEINKFQQAFADAFNAIHTKGQDADGNSTADVPFFVKSEEGNAYSVNKVLLEDASKMATTYDRIEGADNQDLIQDLVELRKTDILEGSTSEEFLQSLVTEVAVETKKEETLEKNYSEYKVTIQNQRLSVMGVDKDEEAMNLVKYQEVFDLNAKVIDIMQQVYDKLINGTGV